MQIRDKTLLNEILQALNQAYPDFIHSNVLKEKVGIPVENKILERELSRLEERGWVERTAETFDNPVGLLKITDLGISALEKWEQEGMGEITEQLLIVLNRMSGDAKYSRAGTRGVPGIVIVIEANIVDLDNLAAHGSSPLRGQINRALLQMMDKNWIEQTNGPTDYHEYIQGGYQRIITRFWGEFSEAEMTRQRENFWDEENQWFRLRAKGKEYAMKLSTEPTLKFSFIKHELRIRHFLKRDYQDIQKCFGAECWKAVVILCGGCLEAILYDVLKQSEAQAVQSNKHGRGTLKEWTLENHIEVATDLGLITKGVGSFSHSLRDYRNLVHPLKEIRGDYKIQREEANASFESLKMAIRDLEETTREN